MVRQPYSGISGSLPPGIVNITAEMRREEEEFKKILYVEGPILKSFHGKHENFSKPILTESGNTSSTRQSIAEVCSVLEKNSKNL